MKIECPNCGSDVAELPEGTTERQARLALLAVLVWYGESPIREIQMADAACGRHFPIKEIKAALTTHEDAMTTSMTPETIVREIQSRFERSKAANAALREVGSYAAGHAIGYHDALGELLEYLADSTQAVRKN